jgi:hypothetical protein
VRSGRAELSELVAIIGSVIVCMMDEGGAPLDPA